MNLNFSSMSQELRVVVSALLMTFSKSLSLLKTSFLTCKTAVFNQMLSKIHSGPVVTIVTR